ncbi:MAG: hypothetical protein IPP40_14780 [bacterium]|nr:hypothetical protein [bacterium]
MTEGIRMFVSIGIHRHPKPEKRELLIDSMRRFGAAMRGCKGLVDVYQLEDKESGALVGLAIWETREDWLAARPAMIEAVKDDPFDEWEDSEPEGFRLQPV